jgi:hypothetical protein
MLRACFLSRSNAFQPISLEHAMSFKLRVSLSHKMGEPNLGSCGSSISVEKDIESSLVTEPAKLKEQIHLLFALARTSLPEVLRTGRDNVPGLADAWLAGESGIGNRHLDNQANDQ